MNLQQYTKIIDGKEIHYFVNDKGAIIEVVKIEPNRFNWTVAYCTIDLYINIYNDDFTRKVSFMVENFSTGIEGESWFEGDEYEDEERKKELIPQISGLLTEFFNCKERTIFSISSLFKENDQEEVVKLLQAYEDDTDPDIDDVAEEFIADLSGDVEDVEDNPELTEKLSKHLGDFFNCKKKTIADICALVGASKKKIIEDFELYEDDAETEEELDIKYIARVIADDMPSQFPDPTEEDSWAQTLDYFSLDDPYDAWEGFKDFWDTFGKYNEELDEEPDVLFDSMINDEELKKWCSTRFSGEDSVVCDFEIIKPKEEEIDYEWEGEYKDERLVERPVFIALNKSGIERKVVKNILIDNSFIDEYLQKTSYNRFLGDHEEADIEGINIFVGEWLVNLWGCARKGRLIGEYCLGGYDLPDWEGETTAGLLRFWKLTGVKHIEYNRRSCTAFYSGQRCWLIDDDLADREEDFYPMVFSYVGDLPNVVEEIVGKVCIPGEEESGPIPFTVELTAIESRIINHYYEYVTSIDILPEELYTKLVSHLQQAYLDFVKDKPGAIKSVDELNELDCCYIFPEMEDEDDE